MKLSSLVFIFLGLVIGFSANILTENSSQVDFITSHKSYNLDIPTERPTQLNCSENTKIVSRSERKTSANNSEIDDINRYNKGNETVLDLVSILLNNETEENYDIFEKNKIEIISILNQDKSARDEIISLYLNSDQGTDFEQDIFEIVSNIDSEKLHELSHELIESGMQRNQILGLDLIRVSKDHNPSTYDTVYELISENQVNRNVLLSSIQVISKSSDSLERKLDILKILEEHSNSGDTEIKLESLLSIGALAKSMDQLKPVLTLPQTEENKAIIAMAIRDNSLVNQELKNLLISYASDLENPPGVRGVAIESLVRFDLTSEERSHMASFVETFN